MDSTKEFWGVIELFCILIVVIVIQIYKLNKFMELQTHTNKCLHVKTGEIQIKFVVYLTVLCHCQFSSFDD